jgi:hypothetical protein
MMKNRAELRTGLRYYYGDTPRGRNAAMIKQNHLDWSPAAIASAMMTTASTANSYGKPLLHSLFHEFSLPQIVNILSNAVIKSELPSSTNWAHWKH